MSAIIDAKRMVALVVLAMMALSAVLSALDASDADARKRHHHRINTVQCPNQPDGITCNGTPGKDRLVGRDNAFDSLNGGEGGNIYDGKGGTDDWIDSSTTSNDRYLIPSTDFSQLPPDGRQLFIRDDGGSSDVLDLSAYRSDDFFGSRSADDLILDGPGKRDIDIGTFFTTNSIDTFKFSDRTITADEIKKDLL
jgi:hypothetical protein